MNIEEIREYCISKEEVSEGFPFDDVTLVFKVTNKMFAILSLDENPSRISLKCIPERALELREKYDSIIPGYHLSKTHWNTISLDGSVPDYLIRELIDLSYELVRIVRKK
ncbi:MAG: MmcQ/YjbR family DNA-binding protein [Marinilabiliaceae bacterium]|jgi:predicted DNA-binding protein (MmcQ/YjbR family)|nr:MmcQ/YjbR family DNA-binding protein [Marinilabiliaceae bacterium]